LLDVINIDTLSLAQLFPFIQSFYELNLTVFWTCFYTPLSRFYDTCA